MKKIFITGCAKSGTTLVRRLFNAFEDLKVCNEKEMTLDEFVHSDCNVAKRTFETIFSAELSHDEIVRQAGLIMINDIVIVNVVRRMSDVLKSDNGYVTKQRYLASIGQANLYKHLISTTIIYDNLIQYPDAVQSNVELIFGLKRKHKWSDYPSFVDPSKEDVLHREGIYSLRKIGEPVK